MTGASLDIQQDQLEKLKQLFPEAITEGKIDWEKLQVSLGKENIEFYNERYVLNWAGKTDAFKVLQQTTTATLKPAPEESINFNTTENVFIEGENLEVLKVLQKSYYGKIKCIIIDPPYNTGSDSFIYPDSFKESREEYQKRIGEKDEEGYLLKEGMFRKNSKDSGHFHSNWLSMMYPRLFLAKNLLRDDGVIFIHIDDNEQHNLRLLMNEIFGEENFVAQIVWQKKYAATNDSKGFSTTHDYIISFQKTQSFKRNLLPRTEEQDKPYRNNDNDGKGLWRADNILVKSFSPNAVFPILNPNTGKEYFPTKGSSWRANQTTMNIWLAENRIFFGKDGLGAPQLKRYLNEVQQGKVPITWWTYEDAGHNDSANRELGELFNSKTPFDTPKPIKLLKLILQIATSNSENEIVLDFFAGSATTAHSVLELNKEDGGNRKFILVQLPEKCDEESEAFKAGYKTIADISKERIRRVIKKITSPPTPLLEERGARDEPTYQESLFKGASPTIFENAHQLRLVDKTKAEETLWQAIRNRKIANAKFRRQHPLSSFIADFYCHEKKLVIEVDGGYHNEQEQKEHDDARTKAISEYGIRVIRFKNEEVLYDLQKVISKITEAVSSSISENRGEQTPSPQGEGRGEVGFKVFKLSSSNFKIWRGNEITEENLEQQLDAFTNPVREGSEKENMLYELILKAGYLLTDKVEAKKKYYSVNDGELIIALEEMNQELIEIIIATKPKKVITLDNLFTGNDQLKTNTVLQMRDTGVDFKTI